LIPATHRYRNAVILALLSKALIVSRAICALVDAGFPAGAFATSRTLIEIYFCVRYISNKETEARAETYANYHARMRQEWQAVIMKYYPNKTPAEIRLDADVLEKAKAFKSKAHWTGHGGQARMMALEEDPLEEDPQGQSEKSEFDYDALYFWTSHFVHATVVAAEAHAAEPGEVFKVHARSWVDKGRAEDALFNIAVFLDKLFIRACRGMNEEQPAVLQDLYKMISDFARPAATPNLGTIAYEEHQ
jgi:uncharacterized protein (DUF4415 family)